MEQVLNIGCRASGQMVLSLEVQSVHESKQVTSPAWKLAASVAVSL